jgi:hypothetical protein
VTSGGFVVASTDMGHEGTGGEFGRDAQTRVDFAYRGVHITALAAKVLIRVYYGREQRFSYFDGCSDGGREALIEAQRYPRDFNGIIAGAPAMNFQVQNSVFHGWQARSNTSASGEAILVASRLPILHEAVLKACDRLDGLADGLISEPGRCHFDSSTAVCSPAEKPATCLTAAEAAVATRFYDGPRDPATGERLTAGGPQYGSELQWAGVYVPVSSDQPIFSSIIVSGSMPNLIFPDGHPINAGDIKFTRATFDRLRARHTLFDSTNPDLARFAGRGGKLILFHGWADPHISPLNTISYHDAVRRHMGSNVASTFERLYLMPGMGHCSGGEGPSAFDLLTPMMAWVERGQAPNSIETKQAPPRNLNANPPGRQSAGAHPTLLVNAPAAFIPRSRPVYPYPYLATYRGAGNPNLARNWVRGPAAPLTVPAWAGSDFYTPYRSAIR